MSRTKGVNLIKKNIGKFQNIITGLESGIKLCEKDMSSNNTKIEKLTNENTTIEKSKTMALTFKTNLSSMLRVPNLALNLAAKTKEE